MDRAVPVRNVEGESIDDILVIIESVDFRSGQRVPDLARPVVASCNKSNDN